MRINLFLFFALFITAHAIARLKFRHWFPQYEQHWISASASCQPQLVAYISNDRSECHSPCACAADCILRNITGTIQSNFASAQVLLGLMPPILAFCGPTIPEMALLSTRRPLLAILLSLASPAISIARLFQDVDMDALVKRPQPKIDLAQIYAKRLATRSKLTRSILQIVIHVLALIAVVNNVRNSVFVDLRTISGWRCGALFMPLVWGLLGLIVHSWGMLAVRVQLFSRRKQSTPTSTLQPKSGNASLFSPRHILSSPAFLEFANSAASAAPTALSGLFFWMAHLCAVVHMVFGVLEMSSLVFISALEAAQVFLIYAAGALLCQILLLLELAELRYELHSNAIPSATPVVSSAHP